MNRQVSGHVIVISASIILCKARAVSLSADVGVMIIAVLNSIRALFVKNL